MILATPPIMLSCGKLEDMSDRTKRMEQISNTILNQSKKTNRQVDDGKLMQRKSEASNKRIDIFFNELRETKEFAAKITLAATFFKAFEYQTWTGVGIDTPEYREVLKKDAVAEFFRNLTALKERIDKKRNLLFFKEKVKTNSNDTDVLSLYALAVAMHKNHYQQIRLDDSGKATQDIADEFFHVEEGFEKQSMYQLIKSALVHQVQEEQNESVHADIKPYIKEVLIYEELAEELIHLRHEMLLSMALAKISDIQKTGVPGLGIKAKMRYLKWDAKYPELNLSQQDNVNKYLETALKAKVFLEDELGVNPRVSKNIRKIYKNMRMDDSGVQESCAECNSNLKEFNEFLVKNNLKE